jgi:protein gp37
MHNCQPHTFYTLTKRPERWKEIVRVPPNVWLGASVWDQESYDKTLEITGWLNSPVKVWFSIEPLLGPIKIKRGLYPQWLIVGAESGKNRRPCNIEWIRDIRRQCKFLKTPLFIKQIDLDGRCSTDPVEWPDDLRIQEYPK